MVPYTGKLTERSLRTMNALGKQVDLRFPHRELYGVVIGVSFDVAGCNQYLVKKYNRNEDKSKRSSTTWLIDKLLEVTDEQVFEPTIDLFKTEEAISYLGTVVWDETDTILSGVSSLRISLEGAFNLTSESLVGEKDHIIDINSPIYVLSRVHRVLPVSERFFKEEDNNE